LYWGIVMLIFGIVMLVLGRRGNKRSDRAAERVDSGGDATH